MAWQCPGGGAGGGGGMKSFQQHLLIKRKAAPSDGSLAVNSSDTRQITQGDPGLDWSDPPGLFDCCPDCGLLGIQDPVSGEFFCWLHSPAD